MFYKNGKVSLIFTLYMLMIILLISNLVEVESRPGSIDDLYDDVANFFDTVNLDEVATSGRSTVPETFCRMPARKGVCRALIPRWSYDPQKKECVEFKFGGCDGNENNFPSYKQCMEVCEGM